MLIGKRYRLKTRLGVGGMGEVWLARDEVLNRTVAVKSMLPDLPKDYRDRFEAEYKLLLTLQHQHIVQLLDRVIEGGRQYVVMELIDGIDLEKLVHESERQLPVAVAVYIADCILDALDFMQVVVIDGERANIVHRDITPQNILISYAGEVHVSDFGVAKLKATWKESTDAPMFIGKRAYAPPEMYATGWVDHRMDLYAVGVLLYEMLSGRRAFPVEDPLRSRARIMRGQIEPLRELNPLVGTDLDAAIAGLMHRDAEHRFQTARAAREALIETVPKASLAKPALRELIGAQFGGTRRPTGLHFSVESYRAAVRGQPEAELALAAGTSDGVPQLVYEPPDKWSADSARPSSSPDTRAAPMVHPLPRRLATPDATPMRTAFSQRVRPILLGLVLSLPVGLTSIFLLDRATTPRAAEPAGPRSPASLPAPVPSSHSPPPTAAPAVEQAQAAVAVRTTRVAATARPREASPATLSIRCASGCRVSIDGAPLGDAPIRAYALSPGHYDLKVVGNDGQTRTIPIMMRDAPLHLEL